MHNGHPTPSILRSLLNGDNQIKDEKATFSFNSLKNDPTTLQFYTGVYTVPIFMWILEIIGQKVTYVNEQLCMEDHLFIVLMKLKLGLLNKDLGYRFGVSGGIVSKIIAKWVPHLAALMKELIVWPNKVTVHQLLPHSFRRKFIHARCIIHCTEVFIERSSDLTVRAQTWSTYRHNNTMKYIVAITPAGAVSFISKGYGGRISTKEIATQSGFFNLVEYGDEILSERGFAIRDELAKRGAILRIPNFTKGKKQLSGGQVEQSRKLSKVRLHVERMISKLKSFHILQKSIPTSHIHLLDHFVTAIAGLINLAPCDVVQ